MAVVCEHFAMRACVMRHGELVVDEVADPVPEFGQVLVRTLACGICGSDLHFLKSGQKMAEMTDELLGSLGDLAPMGASRLDVGQDIVMGHEFCSEVIAAGPDTRAPQPGTRVVSVPVLVGMDGIHQLAYNNRFPGGFAEKMLLSAPMLLEVPDEVDTRSAAMTEPLAVGIHAVERAGIDARESAVVAGCGPVGLAVIAALRMKGVESVVASDPSPLRRRLAESMGATEAVDPREEPLVEAWRRIDGRRSLVAFEAVGVPGMIESLMHDVPPRTRLLVVGVCMDPDAFRPFFAIAKELELRFALAYDPSEFAAALAAIAGQKVDVAPMITGTVGLEGAPAAFEELANPERQVKILVEPV